MTTSRPFAAITCLLLASGIVLSTVRYEFTPAVHDDPWSPGIPPTAAALARDQVRNWRDPAARAGRVAQIRRSNPEWDLMARTFLVLALGEISLRDSSTSAENLQTITSIITATLEDEARGGPYVFLMPYARSRPFLVEPTHSLFVDSEIALMLGVQARLTRGDTNAVASLRPALLLSLEQRCGTISRLLSEAPAGWVESYPDECWLYDHAVALAALLLADVELGTNHRPLAQSWLAKARHAGAEPTTGLLCSSFTVAGAPLEGPEASSLWMTIHLLGAVDPEYSRKLYLGARRELGRSLCGFGWSREWPPHLQTGRDIDSGMVVPLVEASPSGSGLALVAAASAHDRTYLRELRSSLLLAAFPLRNGDELKFAASNWVGDAALLYAMTIGPFWAEVCDSTRVAPAPATP